MELKSVRIKRQVEIRVEFVSIEEAGEVGDTTHEPYAMLRAKTKHLADLLDCTEAEAERLILDRLGA